MSLDLLLPVIGGLVGGVLLALVISRFYLRARGRDAAALLRDAEEKALASLQTAAQERGRGQSPPPSWKERWRSGGIARRPSVSSRAGARKPIAPTAAPRSASGI